MKDTHSSAVAPYALEKLQRLGQALAYIHLLRLRPEALLVEDLGPQILVGVAFLSRNK